MIRMRVLSRGIPISVMGRTKARAVERKAASTMVGGLTMDKEDA